MKLIRHIGSIAFVFGLFTAIFAGIPWHMMVAEDPAVPWWLKMAVFCLLGGFRESGYGFRDFSSKPETQNPKPETYEK